MAVSYQGTQCDFSSVTMICDLSGVAGRDPLHVNKPAAAVVAYPPPLLVCVVDHKPTTYISSPSPTYCPHHHWYVWLTTNPQHTFPPHPLHTAPPTDFRLSNL